MQWAALRACVSARLDESLVAVKAGLREGRECVSLSRLSLLLPFRHGRREWICELHQRRLIFKHSFICVRLMNNLERRSQREREREREREGERDEKGESGKGHVSCFSSFSVSPSRSPQPPRPFPAASIMPYSALRRVALTRAEPATVPVSAILCPCRPSCTKRRARSPLLPLQLNPQSLNIN